MHIKIKGRTYIYDLDIDFYYAASLLSRWNELL